MRLQCQVRGLFGNDGCRLLHRDDAFIHPSRVSCPTAVVHIPHATIPSNGRAQFRTAVVRDIFLFSSEDECDKLCLGLLKGVRVGSGWLAISAIDFFANAPRS